MPTETKTCIDCNEDFDITEGEQEFYASKTDANGQPFSTPKRCRPCRQAKKERFSRNKK